MTHLIFNWTSISTPELCLIQGFALSNWLNDEENDNTKNIKHYGPLSAMLGPESGRDA
ncbi:MAG: hypothetical protein ACJ70R_00645 [Nitrososphaera sp.]